MDNKKLFKELLNKILADKHRSYGVENNNEYIYIILDGIILVRIPGEQFIFNIGRIEYWDGLQKCFDSNDTDEFEISKVTNEIRRIEKSNCVKLESKNNYTWVQEKYLNLFNKDCKFYIHNKSKIHTIQVVENDEVIAYICPVRIND